MKKETSDLVMRALCMKDSEAQYQLGMSEKDKSPCLSVFFLQEAANQGHAPAKKELQKMGMELIADKENSSKPNEIDFMCDAEPEPIICFDEALALAEAGMPHMQYYVYKCYFWGEEGATRNIPKAFEYLKKAALNNYPEAQFRLGMSIYNGTFQNRPREQLGCYWIRRAALTGDPEAQYLLSIEFEEKGATNESLSWLKRAAQNGHQDALFKLAKLRFNGINFTENKKEAIGLWRRAAKMLHAASMVELGDAYFLGEGVPRDEEKAIQWWSAAEARGNSTAQYELGKAHQLGLGPLEKNERKAVELWFEAATDDFNKAAMRELIPAHRYGRGTEKDEEFADWLEGKLQEFDDEPDCAILTWLKQQK